MSQLEELLPKIAGEYRITITNNGVGKPMEADNIIKEGTSH
jgi:hypothetical protein